jgi:hypothetical protein
MMPSDLADVLHYFLPEAGTVGDAPARDHAPEPFMRRPFDEPKRIAALPLVCVPIGEQDVVRAAFAWNLAVETARLGGRAAVVAPISDDSEALWPGHGLEPMGADVILTKASNLAALYRDALDVAVERAVDANDGGVIYVRVPPAWLRNQADGNSLLRWTLMFTSSDRRDLLETYGLAKLLCRSGSRASRLGVTVHGARGIGEAAAAFERLSDNASRHLGRDLTSYGLLVDDLHVYRAIVAQRPIGLVHPQSAAARSLKDVAELVLEDARKPTFA